MDRFGRADVWLAYAMAEVTIQPTKNGSYLVKGPITIIGVDGTAYELEGDEHWLCRCGHSQTKPFCDTSHKRVGFQSEPRVSDGLTC